MSIFNEQEVLLRPPSSLTVDGEARFSDIWRAGRESAIYTDNWNASYVARERAFDEFSDLVRRETGVEIPNPLSEPATLLDQSGEPVPERGYGAITEEDSLRRFEQSRQKLYKQFPGKAQILKMGHSIEEDAERIARESSEDYERLMGSRRDFVGKWSAGIGGAIAGSMRDPMQVLSLILGGGAGAARTVGGRILTTTLKEMAVNGGFEAAIQPKVQAWREKAGLPAGWDQGVQNVLFAGAFGAGFGAAGQTIAEGARLLAKGRTLDTAAAELAKSLDPESTLAKGLNGDEAAAAEALKPIRDMLPPQGRGALDNIEVVGAHTMTETERQRLGARIQAGTARVDQPTPLWMEPPGPTWRTEAERLAGGRPVTPEPGVPPDAPVSVQLQAKTEAERRALAFRDRGPQPVPGAARERPEEGWATHGPGARGWKTEAERLAAKYAPQRAAAEQPPAAVPAPARAAEAAPAGPIDWSTATVGEKFTIGVKRELATLAKMTEATLTFMTDQGKRVVVGRRTVGAADIARAEVAASEPAAPPIPEPEPIPDTGPLSPADPRDPTRPLDPPDEEKLGEALAYAEDPIGNPEFMAKDRIETTGTDDILTEARGPEGGLDDPLAPEVDALTEAMLKEYDPDGALAKSNPAAKAAADEIEESKDLLAIVNACRVSE